MTKSSKTSVPDDRAWERENAPKITRGQVFLSFGLYAVWTIFLIVLAWQRWYGGLQ